MHRFGDSPVTVGINQQCFARAFLLWRDIAQARMQVFYVVPVNEVGIPGSCVFQRSEKLWIAYGILQSLVPGLDERVVVAAPWA